MTPGAQLLIAKNGSVIYQKSYGFHTYEKKTRVSNDDVYDLASLTKILASLPLIINEFELNKLSFKTTLQDLFPEINLGDKKDIKLDEMLSHYSKLTPWIPFYKETLDSLTKKPIKSFYSNNYSDLFKNEVREGLFMSSWNDTIFKRIINYLI